MSSKVPPVYYLANPPSALEYRIAIICALKVEADAVRAVFDSFGTDHPNGDGIINAHGDTNHYTVGKIGNHNVVLAHMPKYGKSTSAGVATNIRHTFPDITLALVVGICGGVPYASGEEVLLGDVIISNCIVEYDLVRQLPNGPRSVNTLGDDQNNDVQGFFQLLEVPALEHYTATYLEEAPNARKVSQPAAPKPKHPGFDKDMLFKPTHRHKHHIRGKCNVCDECMNETNDVCSESEKLDCIELGCRELISRERLDNPRGTKPCVHIGKVASGDTVMKSGEHRDRWVNVLDTIAFEMEGAGVCRKIACVIIKGVCDYADSHKNKAWQGYAAATAAACTKGFLKEWRPRVSMIAHVSTLMNSDPRTILQEAETLRMMRELFVMDPPATRNGIERNNDRLLPGTGSWIFNDEDGNLDPQDPETAYTVFSKWWTNDDSRVLWIRGDPGKGKTMLAMSLIDELERRLEAQQYSSGQTCIAYFFCVYSDEEKRDAAYIVRSLLWQMLSKHPRFTIPIRQIYDTQAKEYLLSTSSAALSSLLHALDQILDEPEFRVYFVIDALDECSVEPRDTLLKYLEALDMSENTKVRSKAKWLITCRNDIEIWDGALTISLEKHPRQIDNAVAQYVSGKVEKLAATKKYPNDMRETVEEYLSGTGNGTFLWVSLVCKELGKVNTINTLKLLYELPRDLVPLYQRILGQVLDNEDPELVSYAINILQTLIVATRPLAFKELVVAAGLPLGFRDKEYYIRDCVLLCGSFLNLEHAGGRVSFVHQSVRDYLAPRHCPRPKACRFAKMYCRAPEKCCCSTKCLTPKMYPQATSYPEPDILGIDHQFPIKEARIQTTLTERCVDYLATEVFNHNPRWPQTGRGDFESTNTSFWGPPFANYALVFWVIHGRKASPELKEVMKRIAVVDGFLIRWLKALRTLRSYEDVPFNRHLPNPEESRLLCIGSYIGIPQLVEVMLENGANVNEKDISSFSALYYAAEGGHEAITRLLLQRGADINARSDNGMTALLAAVRSGHGSVVKVLLEANADHSIVQGAFGQTPLHEAVDKLFHKIADLLIDYGATISATDYAGCTPLHIAAAGGVQGMRGLLRLRKVGGGCSAGAGTVMTARSVKEAKNQAKNQAKNRSYIDMVKLLIKRGANSSAPDKKGHTPLHWAVDGGYESIALELIKSGADIDAMDKDGWAPLQWTAEKGLVNMTRLLLQERADPNKLDKFGRTVLHWVAKEGHTEIARLLLEHGADPNIMDSYSGATALHMAVYQNDMDIVLLLLKQGADPNVQPDVVISHCEDIKAEYAKARYPYSFRMGRWEILLEKASRETRGEHTAGIILNFANDELARVLLEHGANPNLQNRDCNLSTLSRVVSTGRQSLARLLLDKKASPNATDILGKTALHYASNFALAEMLINEGADIDSVDMNGVTALHFAVVRMNQDMVRGLLERGANPTLTDVDGMNALQRSEWIEAEYLKEEPEGMPESMVERVSQIRSDLRLHMRAREARETQTC